MKYRLIDLQFIISSLFAEKNSPDLSNWEWTGMTKQKQQLARNSVLSSIYSKPIDWLIGVSINWISRCPTHLIWLLVSPFWLERAAKWFAISLLSPCLPTMDAGSTRPLWTAIAPAQCPNDLINAASASQAARKKQSEWVNKTNCFVKSGIYAGKKSICNQTKTDLERILKQRKHLRLWCHCEKPTIRTNKF